MRETAVTATTEGNAPQVPMPLVRVGRYTIEGVLGSGGMAVVYLARDPSLDRTIALKVIRADGDANSASRLVREGQALARVVHPNVLHVYEVGREADQLVYIAMERIAGVTLDVWLRTPRTRREILAVFADAGRGLAAAHAAGLVHRDFKPENVMIGDDGRVRVVDFGLARSTADGDDPRGTDTGAIIGLTAHGSVVGTPAYMSPEQWRGERPGVRSDQFSFCVALARALTGVHPFAADSHGSRDELRAAVLAGHAQPLHAVPRRLRSVLRRGLAVDPRDRFESIAAIVGVLAARARWPFAAGALALAGAGAVAAAALTSAPPPGAIAYTAPVPITSRGDIGTASVSPDGTQLALLTRDALVVQAMSAVTEPRVLLRGRLSYYTVSWSPDGQTIALVAARSGDASAPGLVVVDARTGTSRRVADNPGHVALLGDDAYAAAQFADKHVAFHSLRDPSRPLATCTLPQPFVGIRSLRADRGTALVQLDRNDSESTLVRVDRNCKIDVVVQPLAALAFLMRGDGRPLARMLSRNALVEIDDAGAPTATNHLIQSGDYEPLAITAGGGLAHLDRSMRWQLAGPHGDLIGGTGESRFAIAPDGVTIAQVDGVYRRGLVRIGRLDDLRPDLEIIAERVSRVAWSPDGTRLALLSQVGTGYAVATLDVATRVVSPSHPVSIQYDVGMTWIDDRRVAFGVPHEYKGFLTVDTVDGTTGKLAVGDGEVTSWLARAHSDRRLAFVTETATEIRTWTFVDGERPRLVGAIPAPSPRSARRARIVWSADDRAVLVFNGISGELWSTSLDGTVARLPDLPLPRSGGFAELTSLFPLRDRLVFETTTRSADVFVSKPLAD